MLRKNSQARRFGALLAPVLVAASVLAGSGLLARPGLAGKTEDIVATFLEGSVSGITVLEVGRSLFVYGNLAKSNADRADTLCRDAATAICQLFPGRSVLAEWRYNVREKHSCRRQRCTADGALAPNGMDPLPRVEPEEPESSS